MHRAGGWNRWIVAGVVALVATVLPLGAAEAAPMERTWVGPQNGLWSVAANWAPAGVPADGDGIVLPRPSTSRFDLDGLHVDWIISERPPGPGGNDASVSTVNGASLELAGDIWVQGGSGRLQLDVPVVLGGGAHVLRAESPSNILGLGRPVTGSGALALQGNIGRVELLGSNTYTGGTSVETVAVVSGTSPLGTGEVSIVGAWGSLQAAAGTVIPNPVSVAAAPVFLTATGDTTFTGLVEASIDDTAVEVATGASVSFVAGLQAEGYVIFRPPVNAASGGRVELGGASAVARLGAAYVVVDITTAPGSQAIGHVGVAGTASQGVVNFLADEQHDPATDLNLNLSGVLDLWGTDQRADRVQVLDGVLYLGYWHEPDQHRRSTLTAQSLDTYGSSTTVWTIDNTVADLITAGSVRLGGDFQFYWQGLTPVGHVHMLINNTGSGPVLGTFNGAPEGSIYTAGQQLFRLSYVGGNGNDVTLTRVGGLQATWSFDDVVEHGGRMTTAPALSSWGHGRLDGWVVGADRALWHRSSDVGGAAWEPLGGVLLSSPAAVSQQPGEVDVFVRGADNALWTRTYRNGWGPWRSLGGRITEAPAVTSTSPGNIDVVARGADGALWHKRMVNGVWGGWAFLGGFTPNAPAITDWGPGHLDVFVRGGNGALWQRTFDSGSWGPWFSHGGNITDGPAAASSDVGEIAVFVRGADGILWLKSDEFFGWSEWRNLELPILERPAAVGTAPGHLQLGVRDNDGSLLTWHGYEWWVADAASAASSSSPADRSERGGQLGVRVDVPNAPNGG